MGMTQRHKVLGAVAIAGLKKYVDALPPGRPSAIELAIWAADAKGRA